MDAKLIISIALGSIVSSIICYLILILMIKKRKKMSRSRKKKTIIQDLLSNSDEYAKQRAIDFLEEI